MLAIISDLHLTDGSTCETINAGAFRQYVHILSSQAEAACWRRKPSQDAGVFEPLERVDVILLGDILDVIRSEHWFSTLIRPWSASDTLLPDVTAITRGILRHNEEALACFRALNGQLPIVASHTGEVINIPIHFHYMVGNHDWFFHLRGEAWNALRAEICAAMSLANDPTQPFPHLMEESGPLATLCERHRVYLQHGDVHDSINYQAAQGRDASSLGDAIVVETLNGFPRRVKQELGLSDRDPLYLALKEADNIRPLLALPQYLLACLDHYATKAQQQKIHQLWAEAYQPFLDLPFVHSLDKPWQFDTVDMLQAFFSFQQVVPLAWQSDISRFVERFIKTESYREQALKEPYLKSGKADFVVYGHTHSAEMVPLCVTDDEGVRHEQIYLNTGTWRRAHQRGIGQGKGFPFVHFHVMTYAFFYKDDERFGRRHEMWQGSLG